MMKVRCKGDIPDARSYHGAVYYEEKMWIYGGHVAGTQTHHITSVKDEIFCFDFKNQTWSLIGSYPKVTEHSMIVHNQNCFIFGGYVSNIDTGVSYSNLLHSFNFDTKLLEEVVGVCGEAPSPRSAHSAVVHEEFMYIMGGWAGKGNTSFNDLYQFNLDTRIWKKLEGTGVPPPSVRAHCAIIYRNSMYVTCGYGQNGHCNDLYKYDIAKNEWSIIPTTGPAPLARSRARAVCYENKMIVIGGWDRALVSHFSDIYEFNFDYLRWTKLDVKLNSQELEMGIGQHSATIQDHKIFVFGGYLASQANCCNNMYAFHL